MIKYFFVYRFAVLAAVASWLGLFTLQSIPTFHPLLPEQLQKVPTVLYFLVILILWLLLTGFVLLFIDRKLGAHRKYLGLLIVLILGFTGLTSLIEIEVLRRTVNLIAGFSLGALFVAALQEVHAARYNKKRWRRIIVMLWAFGTYSNVTTIFALSLFFPQFPKTIFALIAAAISSYCAYQIWEMYSDHISRQILFWTILMFVMMFEVVAISFVLPFGYLALGTLVIWPWYILQLLIRFHLSPRDILWRKQWTFLGINAILFYLILFSFISWI